ncbi:hypothetical protein [Methylobacterium segetis]|uniref:hypothetical protein n=1 Tax=Methylobacterium segetis TaxID=2488750 RepID=UPI00104CB287|nr:hypothetical protein [Methylobacterium segetis]
MNDRALTCAQCGGVPAIEEARAAIRARLIGTAGPIRAMTSRWRPSRITILWLLALVPVLIGPPLIALLLIGGMVVRRPQGQPRILASHLGLIALLAVANLAVSVWLDMQISAIIVDHVIVAKHALEAWLHELLTIRIVPGGGHSPYSGNGRSI